MPPRILLFAVLFVLAFTSACGRSEPSTTPRIDPTDTPAVVEGEEVTFTTADDLQLHGRLFGDGKVGVVLAHMFPADARSWYATAQRLADLGYVALAFDFRGYGGSDGSRDPSMAAHDVRAALDFLQGDGTRQVALVGASMGATASLIAAASADVLAVVALSAPARFGDLDAIPAAERLTVPVLLLAAQSDDPAHESLSALSGRLARSETAMFEGDAHGTNLLSDRPEALDTIIAFLAEHAPPEPGP